MQSYKEYKIKFMKLSLIVVMIFEFTKKWLKSTEDKRLYQKNGKNKKVIRN